MKSFYDASAYPGALLFTRIKMMKALCGFLKPTSRGGFNLIEQNKKSVLKNVSSFIKRLLGVQKRPDVNMYGKYETLEEKYKKRNQSSNVVSVRAKGERNQSTSGFHRKENEANFVVRGRALTPSLNRLCKDGGNVKKELFKDEMEEADKEIKEGIIEESTQQSGNIDNSALGKDKVTEVAEEVKDKYKTLMFELNAYLAKK